MANFDDFDVVDLPEVDETFVEKVNKNSGWRIGTDIVPSVFYQAYFEDGAWNADDESTYRVYVEEPSEVKPEVMKKKEEAAAADPDAAPADPSANPDPNANPDPSANPDPADPNANPAPADQPAADSDAEEVDRELPLLKANKYGFAKPYEVVRLEITPSASLKDEYPFAIVVIDGKEYDLGILDEPLRFVMSKDHRVVLDWKHGEIYESFRIVVNR
jgi:hypothetical protein